MAVKIEYDGYLIKIHSKFSVSKPVIINKNNLLQTWIHENDSKTCIAKVVSPKSGITNLMIYTESPEDAEEIRKVLDYEVQNINLDDRIFYTKDEVIRVISCLRNLIVSVMGQREITEYDRDMLDEIESILNKHFENHNDEGELCSTLLE